MDCDTRSILADMGAKVVKGARVSHLLFAADTVFVAKTPELLQLCLRKFMDELEGVGLSLNPSKSSALVICPTIGKWGVDSGVSIVDRDGIRLPMLGVQDSYKYLGLQFGSEGFKWQPAQGVLEKGLHEITTAPLKAGQRLYVLKNHLIPKLMHVLVLAMAPRQFLVNMDRLVRASVTSWVGIPTHSALGPIHGGIAVGGPSVPRLAKVVPLLQRDRLQSLVRSAGGDEVLAAVVKTDNYGKLVARSLKQ